MIIVGVVMLAYVLFGGMIATTWVQIIKAVLLLFGVTLLTVLVLAQFHFSPGALYAAVAARYGQSALEPGGLVTDPVDAVSLGIRADVRAARAAAHPDAVLHRARRARRADVGALRDRIHRLLLPDHPDRRFRRVGARRPRDRSGRSTPAATWRRRSSPSCSAGRRSSGSSPRSRSPPSWPSSPG